MFFQIGFQAGEVVRPRPVLESHQGLRQHPVILRLGSAADRHQGIGQDTAPEKLFRLRRIAEAVCRQGLVVPARSIPGDGGIVDAACGKCQERDDEKAHPMHFLNLGGREWVSIRERIQERLPETGIRAGYGIDRLLQVDCGRGHVPGIRGRRSEAPRVERVVVFVVFDAVPVGIDGEGIGAGGGFRGILQAISVHVQRNGARSRLSPPPHPERRPGWSRNSANPNRPGSRANP